MPACRGGECRVRLEILRPGTASDRLNCLPDRAQLSRGSIQARTQSANPRWPKRPTQRACPVGLVTAAAGCRLRAAPACWKRRTPVPLLRQKLAAGWTLAHRTHHRTHQDGRGVPVPAPLAVKHLQNGIQKQNERSERKDRREEGGWAPRARAKRPARQHASRPGPRPVPTRLNAPLVCSVFRSLSLFESLSAMLCSRVTVASSRHGQSSEARGSRFWNWKRAGGPSLMGGRTHEAGTLVVAERSRASH